MSDRTCIFASSDIDYLASTFNEGQLRRELRQAKVQQSVYQQFGEDQEEYYWHDYAEAVKLALDIIRSHRPKPKPIPGRVNVIDIKARADMVAEVERYTKLRKSGSRFIGSCPLHEDKHPSLVVYPDQQSWHCFQCNRGGDVIAFTQAVEHTDFRGAAAILGGR